MCNSYNNNGGGGLDACRNAVMDRSSIFGRVSPGEEPRLSSTEIEAVRAELESVLAGPDFARSRTMQLFLRFVVEESLQGRAGRLKGYTIGVEAIGRDPSFDPSTDTIVRTQAARVRRALEHHYLTAGRGSLIRIDLPAGGYRPVFRLAASVDCLDRIDSPPAADVSFEPEIVLQPVSDLSRNGVLASFVDELSLQMLVAFSRFEGFRIVSDKDQREWRTGQWGSRTGPARFLLAVAVFDHHEAVRATAVLHDALSGEVLWSDTNVYPLTHATRYEVQKEISLRISCELADLNGVIPRSITRRASAKPAHDLTVYEVVYQYLNNPIRTREQYVELLTSLQRTVDRYPTHSFANAILAAANIHDYNYLFNVATNPLERALELARRAVTLDPDSQCAELYLAYAYVQRHDYDQFLVHAERCIELNPHASLALGHIGLCMTIAGEWETGVRLARRAMELNPRYSRYLHHAPFMDCMRRGDFQSALAEARLYSVPGFFWAPLVRAAALGKLGKTVEGQAAVAELLSLRPDFPERGRELIARFVPDSRIAGIVVEGLTASGLLFARGCDG